MGRSSAWRPRQPGEGTRTESTSPGTAGSGLALLQESAVTFEATAQACDDPGDARRFSYLAARLRSYLASSRPTTALGMPHIPSTPRRFGEEIPSSIRHPSHVRVLHE